MENEVIIETLPVTLPKSIRNSGEAGFRKEWARKELKLAKDQITFDLESQIPVQFHFSVVLNLSITVSSMKVKVDYSEIKSQRSKNLIRYFLEGKMDEFYEELSK